jgi:radical SAM protein with 4Fe4S-binding SPASM domain
MNKTVKDIIDDSLNDIIKETKNYCPLPWVHFHMSHNAETYPCCVAVINERNSFGNLNENSFDEVWHGDKLNRFRKRMLEDKPDPACYVCHLQEKLGEWSHRHDAIKKFHNRAKPAIETTDIETGKAPDAKPVFLDLRFSNICNMRCRMCGLYASSRWYHDAIALKKEYGTSIFVQEEKDIDDIVQIIGIDDNRVPDLFNSLEKHIDYMDEVYFAGGEPLITDEHYQWLDRLLAHNRNDIFIRYNTNLSKLKYKTKNVIDYWNQFENVKIFASLDEMWKRAELIRKDTVWSEIEENLQIIKDQAPHVQLNVSCTVQNLNSYNVFEFHKYLVDKGFIGRDNFYYNVLTNPSYKSIRVMPSRDKEVLTQIYKNHAAWINEEFPHHDNETIFHTIDYMNGHPENEEELKKLCITHAQIDKLRNEDTRSTFPDLSHIWEKYWPDEI